MGSHGDQWLRCAWCWKCGKSLADEYLDGAEPLTSFDMVGLLCDRCIELAEPAWWPNNRQRYTIMIRAMWLRHIMSSSGPGDVAALVAAYLAANVP